MGSAKSKYKIVAVSAQQSTPEETPLQAPDWLALPIQKLQPLRAESLQICGNLGKGKFGLVCLCRHLPSTKHVAVKYMPKDIIFENQCLIRIQQVLRINKTLS